MKTYKQPWLKAHPFWALLSVVFLVVGVIAALELTNTTFFFHKRPQLPTAGPATKGEINKPPRVQTETEKTATKDDQSKNEEVTSGVDTNVPLAEPSGTFVSNHHPNLGGKPAPNQIQSVCTTTSGAKCSIVFTKDGVTKSLPAQMTDSEGTTYWTWKLQDIGLTAGSWHVEAKATLGSQTKTASDLMNLEVAE